MIKFASAVIALGLLASPTIGQTTKMSEEAFAVGYVNGLAYMVIKHCGPGHRDHPHFKTTVGRMYKEAPDASAEGFKAGMLAATLRSVTALCTATVKELREADAIQ